MITLTALDALPIATDRLEADPLPEGFHSQAGKLWNAAFELWRDEWETYQALSAVGLHGAASAALVRKQAAVELCAILNRAF